MYKNKLDVERIAKLYQEYNEVYHASGLAGFNSDCIQIMQDVMEEVAPLAEWNLNQRIPNQAPQDCQYQHEITRHGVKFISISRDEIQVTK